MALRISKGDIINELDAIYRKYFNQGQKFSVLNILSSERGKADISDIIHFSEKSRDVIISIPHSGLIIPIHYLDLFRKNNYLMEVDLFSDHIFNISRGLHIKCLLPTFLVDMNRDRQATNDKKIPAHLRNNPINYMDINGNAITRRKHTSDEKKELYNFYELYHEAIELLIKRMKEEFGYALLIDGHSMTPVGLRKLADYKKKRSDFVIGTLHGESSDQRIISAFADSLDQSASEFGFSVVKDMPYSGGFITRKHHDPKNNIHAIQLEVNMATYLQGEPGKRTINKDMTVKICSMINNATESAIDSVKSFKIQSP